jgi:hypothetical protein
MEEAPHKKGAKDFLRSISLGRGDVAPGEAEEKVVLKLVVSWLNRGVMNEIDTNHREDGGENTNILGRRGDVVVPVVVGREKVEHNLHRGLVTFLFRPNRV